MHRSHTEVYLHFVWATKNRERLIAIDWEPRLHRYIENICLDLKSQPVAVNGTEDHVHVLLRASPMHSAATIAQRLKGASSHMVNVEDLARLHCAWQDGYGAFSVSPRDVASVARYIRDQKRHHGQGCAVDAWETCNVDAEEQDQRTG